MSFNRNRSFDRKNELRSNSGTKTLKNENETYFGRRKPMNSDARTASYQNQRHGIQKDGATQDEKKTYRSYEYQSAELSRHDYEADLPRDNLLSGRNPIREALKNNRDFEKILVQKGELSGSAREIIAIAKERKIVVQTVDKTRMDEIVPHHQGLIAFVSAYQYASVNDILQIALKRQEDPFLIILDGVTDPHNLGAVIRTAECAGAHGVIIPQRRSVGLTPAVVKASAGAIEHMKVARVSNLNRTIEELKQKNIWIYAVTMNGTDYRKVRFHGGTALVIGAEGEGISRLTQEKCDMAISLPMKGKIESLNASVAAGVMLYHVMNTRELSLQEGLK